MLKVPLAEHKGELIAPSAARALEYAGSTLALRCPDPECWGALVLVDGPQRAAHFRHRVVPEHKCTGTETALHRMAKEAIQPGRRLLLPPWSRDHLPAHERDAARNVPTRRPRLAGCEVTIVSAEIEKALQGARLDVACQVVDPDGCRFTLDLEVVVTHRCGRRKRMRLHLLGRTVIEIDLSPLTTRPGDDWVTGLPFALLLDPTNRRWIAHAEGDASQRVPSDHRHQSRHSFHRSAAHGLVVALERWPPLPKPLERARRGALRLLALSSAFPTIQAARALDDYLQCRPATDAVQCPTCRRIFVRLTECHNCGTVMAPVNVQLLLAPLIEADQNSVGEDAREAPREAKSLLHGW